MTVIDAYDVSLRATQRTLEAAQHEAAISKKEYAELENKITEMEKKMVVLQDNYEQQLETQRKGIHTTVLLLCNFYVNKITSVYTCDSD